MRLIVKYVEFHQSISGPSKSPEHLTVAKIHSLNCFSRQIGAPFQSSKSIPPQHDYLRAIPTPR